MESDVVTYTLPSGALGIAAVEKLRRDGTAELSPLALERDSGYWVEQGGHGASPPALICASLDALQRIESEFSQRAVADRVANPHGEHAENVWKARARAWPAALRGMSATASRAARAVRQAC